MPANNHIPNILLVDDQIECLEIMEYALRKMSLKLYRAENGKQALKVLKDHSIDLVITDTNMPEMCGLKLVEHIAEFWPQVPVVMFFSGHATRRDVDNAFIEGLGVEHILQKPDGHKLLPEIVSARLP